MCENTQEEFILPTSVQDFAKIRKCLKCEDSSTVVTRVNEAMCKKCFMEYFVHKFRATIGKNRLFDHNDVVLFPFSGSASSVAMLHLIKQGVSEEAKKKFQFKTELLYVEDSSVLKDVTRENRMENILKIQKMCEYSGFKVYYSLIENVFSDEFSFTDDPSKIVFNDELEKQVKDLFENTKTLTSKSELVKRLRYYLIYKIGEKLNMSKIILAINCTKLTIELLSNVSLGKAAHLFAEVGLRDLRKNFTVIKPLRELTAKEIAFYNYYNKNEIACFKKIASLSPINSTIYRLTERFVINLQNNFPTTLSTLFRVTDKFSNPIDDDEDDENASLSNDLCALCQLNIDRKSESITCAVNDVEFAKILTLNNNESVENNELMKNLRNSMCYSCRLILRDSSDLTAFDTFIRRKNEENMKNSIKDYLINEEN